jgi:hypothetical protein
MSGERLDGEGGAVRCCTSLGCPEVHAQRAAAGGAERRCRTCRRATRRVGGLRIDCAEGQGYGIDIDWGCGLHEAAGTTEAA